jgi:hypothetical protein
VTTRKVVHLTEEALQRTPLTAATASMVSVRVLRGYGLELTLFDSISPMALGTVTYRDLNPTKELAVKHPMAQLAYTLKRRPDVSEPFDVEVSYDQADAETDATASGS